MSQLLISGLNVFFQLLEWVIFIRIILSWFPLPRNFPIVGILHMLTDPVLLPVKKMLGNSPIAGSLDFSPIIALFFLRIIKSILISLVAYLPI